MIGEDLLEQPVDLLGADRIDVGLDLSMGLEINAQTGEKIEGLVKATMATPKDIVDKAEAMSKL